MQTGEGPVRKYGHTPGWDPDLLFPFIPKLNPPRQEGSKGNLVRINKTQGKHRYAVYYNMLHLALCTRCAWIRISGIIKRSDFPCLGSQNDRYTRTLKLSGPDLRYLTTGMSGQKASGSLGWCIWATTAPVRRLVSLSSSLKRGLQKLEAVFELPVLLRKARSARSPIWDVLRIQALLRTFRALWRQVEKKIVGNERKGR